MTELEIQRLIDASQLLEWSSQRLHNYLEDKSHDWAVLEMSNLHGHIGRLKQVISEIQISHTNS